MDDLNILSSAVVSRSPASEPAVPASPDPISRADRPLARRSLVAKDALAQRLPALNRAIAGPGENDRLATGAGTVWFDYTDLIHYFDDNRVPTGIQRVQIGIFRATLARDAGVAEGRVSACSFDPLRRCWVPVPDALLASVCRSACHANTSLGNASGDRGLGGAAHSGDDEAWRALTAALRQAVAHNPACPFAPGDVLVNVGTSWWIPDYLRYVQHLQRERGVMYAPFVHDCIPLRVPETCASGLVEEFREWFDEAMRVADMVLANSQHTARDILEFAPIGPSGARVEPHVVRLDARFDDGPQPGQAACARLDALTHARLGIRGPFALFVATVEARKNHIFVFQCWQALIERHGEAVPDLICVGKQGWLVEYTLNWLRVHPQLAGRIRLVGTLSDLELSSLYRTAMFTAYCSHYEGWGLPVTESLCHGRVPLVPDHSSLPEAGGPFALYYEPGSREQFCAAAERLLDPVRRSEMEARIRARYRPRGWADVMEQIVGTVRRAEPGRGAVAPQIQHGCIYGFARRPRGVPNPVGIEPGQALKHGLGWWVAEEWGCWSRLPEAHLLLRMPNRARIDQLYLIVRGGPGEQMLRVQAGGHGPVTVALPTGLRRLVRLQLDASSRGRELLVTFAAPIYSLGAFTGGGDPREIGFGLEALAVTSVRDTVARLDVLEFFQAPR